MKQLKKKTILTLVLLQFLNCCLLSLSGKNHFSFQVIDLKTEYLTNPLGIDVSPRLSWKISSDSRGFFQQAYQVVIASSPEDLEENDAYLWNSGKVESSRQVGIAPQFPLHSKTRYYWKVRVWDKKGRVSDWSVPAFFETALLSQNEWYAGWIGYVGGMPGRVLYFKGSFFPKQKIKKARMYLAGVGYSSLYVNKQKVGDHVLDPALSNYSKRIYYVTYDVTSFLNQSANSIVIPVGPGWLGMARLRAQMEITYADNSTELLTSDHFRSVTSGPIVYSTIFDGETYDARLDNEDLHKPGVPTGLMNKYWAWAQNTDEPTGKMVAQMMEPIKIVEEIVPQLKQEVSPGVYVFDAGRNLAGWAKLKVKGKKGTRITIRFAETLYENGKVNQDNLRNAKATDTYILKGEGIEEWEPSFTYHGFRYFQIEGFPYRPGKDDVKVKVVRSAVKKTGAFRCSNQLLNDIHQMVVNTEASNLHSVPTDCPQRDERMGWLNDLTVRIEQAIYNFDMSKFYPKFTDDIADTQDEQGRITCVAPFKFGMRPADPVCASYLILAEKCYTFYGNYQMIVQHYDGFKAWVDYLHSRTKDNIVDYSYYGDWCPPQEFLAGVKDTGVSGNTPGQMISTGYFYLCSKLLSEMAAILGKSQDVDHYNQVAKITAEAFNKKYWNETIGGYASNNQASNAFALFLKIVKPENINRVVQNLVKDVQQHDYHLTTGNLCTKYLLETLTEYGYVDVAYKIACQTTYPSWGFMLKNGATTLWERWEYLTGDAMNSHNHPMMGSVGSWFYKYILGIVPEFEHPGFSEYFIKPYFPAGLTSAEGSLETVKGKIAVSWKKQGKMLSVDISIPENTTAKVCLPVTDVKKITEGGRKLSKIKEIENITTKTNHVVVFVSSGNYHFRCKL